jgi:hypothetical protein
MAWAAVGSTAATRTRAAVSIEVTATWSRAAIADGKGTTVSRGARSAITTRAITTRTRAAIRGGTVVVAPRRTRTAVAIVSEVAIVARALLAVVGRSGQRNLGRGFSLRSGTAQGRPRSGQDSGRLGAHAKHAPAARGQNLEIELVEAHAKLFSGPA